MEFNKLFVRSIPLYVLVVDLNLNYTLCGSRFSRLDKLLCYGLKLLVVSYYAITTNPIIMNSKCEHIDCIFFALSAIVFSIWLYSVLLSSSISGSWLCSLKYSVRTVKIVSSCSIKRVCYKKILTQGCSNRSAKKRTFIRSDNFSWYLNIETIKSQSVRLKNKVKYFRKFSPKFIAKWMNAGLILVWWRITI